MKRAEVPWERQKRKTGDCIVPSEEKTHSRGNEGSQERGDCRQRFGVKMQKYHGGRLGYQEAMRMWKKGRHVGSQRVTGKLSK